jgi:hypothetical protein
MLHYQSADRLHIVPPDRINQATGEHKARPARDAVTPGQDELGLCEFRFTWLHGLRMVLPQRVDRRWIAAPDLTKQILRLVLELIEVGTDGKVTIGHDEPPLGTARGPLASGTKEVRRNRAFQG